MYVSVPGLFRLVDPSGRQLERRQASRSPAISDRHSLLHELRIPSDTWLGWVQGAARWITHGRDIHGFAGPFGACEGLVEGLAHKRP